MGTAVGGTTRLEHDYVDVSARGQRWDVDHRPAGPHLHRAFSPSALASEVAERIGAHGPVQTVSTGCTSGLDAIGYAFHAIEEGKVDVCIAGASDSPISPITVACFDAIKATSPRNDDPAHASRPFDRERDGFVLGEGAAVLVLEEAERARRRGAPMLCAVTGFATRGNAYHMTGLTREGVEMAEAITQALAGAKCDPTDVDYVNAHGSGTRQNDRHETAAFKRVLGEHAYTVPVSSIKSMVGQPFAAGGALQAIATALMLVHGIITPTINYEDPDPECDVAVVGAEARQAPALATVLLNAFGYGGSNVTLVVRRHTARGA
jgi:minimal PKS ketosynthase (KS/KS alpha)